MQIKILVGLTLGLLTAIIASYGYASEYDTLMNEFKQWKAENNKYYSEIEELYRLKIFTENLQIVKEHNLSQKYTFTMAMNQFADLSNDEFAQQYLNYKHVQQNHEVKLSGAPIPDVQEWSTKVPIRHQKQGACGASWAMSGITALEVTYAIAGKNIFLSVQELIDCVHEAGYLSDGCNGGYTYEAFMYSDTFGIANALVYPYKDIAGQCEYFKTPRYKSKDHVYVEKQNAQALKEAITQTAVSVAINAGSIQFQLYKSGIYNRFCAGDEDSINHAVIATGYDNIQQFHRILNSWGSNWGENGYIRLGYVDTPEGQCGLQQFVAYPIV